MKTHDVQSILIDRPAEEVFAFVAQPENLPKWTNAFKEVKGTAAQLETPGGAVPIRLETAAQTKTGTIDWTMTFPDGAVGTAYSRVTPDGDGKAIYSFVLMAPPVPLEALEGALSEQMGILAHELVSLKDRLEA